MYGKIPIPNRKKLYTNYIIMNKYLNMYTIPVLYCNDSSFIVNGHKFSSNNPCVMPVTDSSSNKTHHTHQFFEVECGTLCLHIK